MKNTQNYIVYFTNGDKLDDTFVELFAENEQILKERINYQLSKINDFAFLRAFNSRYKLAKIEKVSK